MMPLMMTMIIMVVVVVAAAAAALLSSFGRCLTISDCWWIQLPQKTGKDDLKAAERGSDTMAAAAVALVRVGPVEYVRRKAQKVELAPHHLRACVHATRARTGVRACGWAGGRAGGCVGRSAMGACGWVLVCVRGQAVGLAAGHPPGRWVGI